MIVRLFESLNFSYIHEINELTNCLQSGDNAMFLYIFYTLASAQINVIVVHMFMFKLSTSYNDEF